MTEEAEERLDRYAELLRDSPINLVSRGARASVRERHIVESRAVVEHLNPRPDSSWLDLGTGGGLPGIVLAIERPDVEVVLADARAKKVREVERFCAVLGVANAAVRCGRAEQLARDPELRGRFDGVLVRALGTLPVVAELARGFVGPGGEIVAVKGPGVDAELEAGRSAADMLGLDIESVEEVADAATVVRLVRFRAVGAPPATTPRADGVPQRHPLA
ncbi:16S rRNA (guanine(527)-N(7))-methyltransferase RsmG [Egibacter rhizosphaerae]|uniref:16S rRNA (guanine(527)-N(7))-methyltransferase RsmG n=1 Tax=Egibacter rhizosphaerae TaxID=1670831 RepID=UPI0013F14DEA|nr:16S rRNA (guanine(527)-N(7))-methyltransferase RsmG [Egibacter rhizosphaerae]